jgi:hypothetical protein
MLIDLEGHDQDLQVVDVHAWHDLNLHTRSLEL